MKRHEKEALLRICNDAQWAMKSALLDMLVAVPDMTTRKRLTDDVAMSLDRLTDTTNRVSNAVELEPEVKEKHDE